MKMKIIWSILFPISLLALPLFASAATHAGGTNVISNGTIYMITTDGQRRPYTSAGAFLSYGFNSWNGVVQASSDDLALPVGDFIPPRDGSIICSISGSDKGTCYLITNSKKAAFTSEEVFNNSGFTFKTALYGDVSFLATADSINNAAQAHLPGTLINDNGTIKLIGTGGNVTVGIPSISTLQSWGYTLANVVSANSADQNLQQNDILGTHTPGELAWADGAPPTTAPTPAPVQTPNSAPVVVTPTPISTPPVVPTPTQPPAVSTPAAPSQDQALYQSQYQAVQAKLAPLQNQLSTLQASSASQCSGNSSWEGTVGVQCGIIANQSADISEYENAILSDFTTPVTNQSIALENAEDGIFNQIFQIKMDYAQAYGNAALNSGTESLAQGRQQQLTIAANAQITALNQQLQTVRLEYQ